MRSTSGSEQRRDSPPPSNGYLRVSYRTATIRRRLQNLVGHPIDHRFLTTAAPPVTNQRIASEDRRNGRTSTGLDIRAANSSRSDFHRRTDIVQCPLEDHQTVFLGAFRRQIQRAVEDPFGGRFLTALHHDVDELRESAVVNSGSEKCPEREPVLCVT